MGSREQVLPGGDKRGAVFTWRGRHREALHGSSDGPWSPPVFHIWSLVPSTSSYVVTVVSGEWGAVLIQRGSAGISFYSAGMPAGTIERVPDTGCYLVGHL